MRADWDALFAAGGLDAVVESASVGGVASAWLSTVGAQPDRVLLYFHGGGYKLGSTRSHQDLMTRIAAAARCRVLGVNYRLAPEYCYPAPLDDAIAVYEGLLASGVTHNQIAVAGDSAGGGLAAALLLSLRARGAPLPIAAVMLSAWMDLTAQSDSYHTRAARDPIHQRQMILATARAYLGEHGDPTDPLVSPLFADLHDLPPMLLQSGRPGNGTGRLDAIRAQGARLRRRRAARNLRRHDSCLSTVR